jgi:hypothetical protein
VLWRRLPHGSSTRPQGAGEALAKLEKLNRDYLVNLHDAVVVSLGGGFWGVGR